MELTRPRIAQLRFEHRTDDPFVAVPEPRISWIVADVPDGWTQAGAEVRIDGGEPIALSGAEHLLRPWPFAPLDTIAPHVVELRALGGDDLWSDWSEPVSVRWSAVSADEWSASFIELATPERPAQPALFRKRLQLRGAVEHAVLSVSALGAVRASIDGAGVDDAVLSPGWTSYSERVLADAIDVSDALVAEHHTLVLEATGAWYTEQYGFGGEARRVYGEQPAVAAQLEVQYRDGTRETFVTGPDWQARGDWQIVESGIYAGERVDLRLARDWTDMTDGDGWSLAAVRADSPTPVARTSEPVRVVDTIEPTVIGRTAAGGVLLDFRQNFAGRLRAKISGAPGTEIVFRHAEVLEGGELATRPLRFAEATDRFILAGEGVEKLEPFGTFHGFRYAEILGWPGEFDPMALQAQVLSSDLRRTGWFESSHPLLNRLHENVVWSMRSNFLAVPTDCPQRDERMGWTGDVQVFAPTASTLFEPTAFLSNWLDDLRTEQVRHQGVVPFVVPDVLGFPPGVAAGWGDAATVVPAVLHERSGDSEVLVRQFESMRDWMQAVGASESTAGLWEGDIQFGDWLDPSAPPENPGAARADRDLVATAHWFRSLRITADAARATGLPDEAAEFRDKAESVRQAFIETYVTRGGRLMSDAPTAYALTLTFGLVEEPELRRRLGDRLSELVRRDGYRIGTGFLGTPHLLDALVDTGHSATAEALLLQTQNPSWLYPVTRGATTVWERWDSLLDDGSINPGEMTSFNHYAFGAVVDWMHRRLAGVASIEPGYRKARFAPVPFTALDHARTVIETSSGRFEGGWRKDGRGSVVFELFVPAHATAVVALPGGAELEVGPGAHQWTETDSSVAPRSGAGSVSLLTPYRILIDDVEAHNAVINTVAAFGDAGKAFHATADWASRTPLVAGLFALPPEAIQRIAEAFGALNATRERDADPPPMRTS